MPTYVLAGPFISCRTRESKKGFDAAVSAVSSRRPAVSLLLSPYEHARHHGSQRLGTSTCFAVPPPSLAVSLSWPRRKARMQQRAAVPPGATIPRLPRVTTRNAATTNRAVLSPAPFTYVPCPATYPRSGSPPRVRNRERRNHHRPKLASPSPNPSRGAYKSQSRRSFSSIPHQHRQPLLLLPASVPRPEHHGRSDARPPPRRDHVLLLPELAVPEPKHLDFATTCCQD